MAPSLRLALRPVPPDDGLHAYLTDLGLKKASTGRNLVSLTLLAEGAVVIDDPQGTFPFRALARRLAAGTGRAVDVYRAEGEAFEAEEEGLRVSVDWSRFTASADGSFAAINQGEETHTPTEEDGRNLRALSLQYTGETLGTLIAAPIDDPPVWTQTWRLPDTPLDPWLDERLAPGAATVWHVGTTTIDLDGPCTAYLAWRVESVGRLDRDQGAPDLARWRERLLRRHGNAAAPGFVEDWDRLTRADRAKRSTRDGHLPAWKLLGGHGVFEGPELGWLRESFATLPGGHQIPAAFKASVDAILTALNGAVAVDARAAEA